MDERQVQIRERAGLEESRLNQDFIDWLRKWGTPILFVAAIGAAGFAVQQRWAKAKAEKVDNAFIELSNAGQGDNPSPDALTAVANEYDGVRAVGQLARLQAADAYLDAVRRGIRLGATFKVNEKGQQDGTLENAEDVLQPELKATYLSQAGELYQAVYTKSEGQPAKVLMAVNAAYGLAAVAEAQEKYDLAKGWYEKIVAMTDQTPFQAHAEIAKARSNKLADLAKLTPVLSLAELPKRPEPPAPPKPPTPIPAPSVPQPAPAGEAPAGSPATSPAPSATPEPATDPATPK